MHFDIHGYDTREAGSMNVYFPTVHCVYIWVAYFGMICQVLWITLRIYTLLNEITEFTKV